MTDSPLRYLGLMRKAGKLEIGEVASEEASKRGKANLLLLAQDAGVNTRKHAEKMAYNSNVILINLPYGKNEFSHSIGMNHTALVAVTDIGFADAFLTNLAKEFPQFQEQADKIKIKKENAENKKVIRRKK